MLTESNRSGRLDVVLLQIRKPSFIVLGVRAPSGLVEDCLNFARID